MTDYLTLADTLAMHHVLIEKYGGAHGIRDGGALEAALFRPQTGYYDDVIAEAAALMESLAINHPFIDGNKRIAFAVTDTFLRINGYRLMQTSEGVYVQMLQWFESGHFEFKYIDVWLRQHISQLQ